MKEKVIGIGREKIMKRFALITPLLEEEIRDTELARRRCLLLEREEMS